MGKAPEKKSSEDNPVILKYIKNHVRDLFHIPMAILIKSAAILTEDLFIEAIPAAWELLLETNQVNVHSTNILFHFTLPIFCLLSLGDLSHCCSSLHNCFCSSTKFCLRNYAKGIKTQESKHPN